MKLTQTNGPNLRGQKTKADKFNLEVWEKRPQTQEVKK